MREILFRGKRVDNGEWVEGGIIPLDVDSGYVFIAEPFLSASTLPVHEIVKNYMHLVIPKTVGQFTGVTDNNGKKIFEGDIVECAGEDELLKVEWCEDTARFKLSASTFCCDFDNYWGYEIEVIDNIHDNPELLT